MEEIKEIILSHCQGIAYPEFDLEDLNVMVKEIEFHFKKISAEQEQVYYNKIQGHIHYNEYKTSELSRAKEDIERLKKYTSHKSSCSVDSNLSSFEFGAYECDCGLDELLKEVK